MSKYQASNKKKMRTIYVTAKLSVFGLIILLIISLLTPTTVHGSLVGNKMVTLILCLQRYWKETKTSYNPVRSVSYFLWLLLFS